MAMAIEAEAVEPLAAHLNARDARARAVAMRDAATPLW